MPGTKGDAVEGAASAAIVWRFTDAKPGHDNQSLGLLAALAALRPLSVIDLPIPAARRSWQALVTGRWPQEISAPPVLAIGAGHGTHLPLLAARRCTGARTVVLMRPSLPMSWFDLCIVPSHDRPPRRDNVLVTRGALNRIRRGAPQAGQGLVLLGGPSRHFVWDEALVMRQIDTVINTDRGTAWTIATSRRTPAAFERALAALASTRVSVVPATATDRDWLPRTLTSCAQVWVTMDSVSMVYEALTAGTAVGLIELGQTHPSRLSDGLAELAAEGWVVSFSDWRSGTPLAAARHDFNEADRCARWMVDTWGL